jgi:diadenosine tetraphosphatase ApaH/serine/threonine PP2A family protein phosphatase
MKSAILSDVHGNLIALEAVLRDISKNGGVDQYWSLGDIVDYGPEPHWCLERMRQMETLSIAGNHEYAIAGQTDLSRFQPRVTVVTGWTKDQLNAEEIDYLKKLPLSHITGNFTLAHGSPRDPVWEYILSEDHARQNLGHFQTRYCLVGHTHVQICFQLSERGQAQTECKGSPDQSQISNSYLDQLARQKKIHENIFELGDDRYIINAGSVGQPRDGDPRAAYAIFNSSENCVEFRRVEYDVAATQRRMVELELPLWLSERLAKGQ